MGGNAQTACNAGNAAPTIELSFGRRAQPRSPRSQRADTTVSPVEVLTLLKGGMGATEVARKLKIGRASVYRILEAATAK